MKFSSDTPHIAILVGTSRDWGRNLVKGILAYAETVVPWHVWVRPGDMNVFESLPQGWKGDGVIARVHSASLAKELADSGLPVVNVSDTAIEGFSAPCIRTDDRISAEMAVDHFIERGFRHIAIAGPHHRSTPRWYSQTFQQILAERKVPCEVFHMPDHEGEVAAALIEWIKKLPKPVGILTLGHNMGRAIVDHCREIGISVPHDVAVLSGNYDELMCHACFPALSGIVTPTEQIGYRAAELLQEMMDGKQVPHKNIYLPPLGIKECLSTNTLAVRDPQLVQVIHYIRDHAFEPITMNDILHKVPMSRRSLDRRFAKAFGRTPNDEIRRLRINKARRLLAETNMQMQLIAEACGYATYNYLTHVFKQATGITPSEYRKRARR